MKPASPLWIEPVLFVALTLVTNAFIFSLGWDQDASSRVDISPPGWVIGAVWVVLLALLGVAHARLRRRNAAPGARRAIRTLLVLCLTYPFYTGGLSSDVAALIGNFAVMAWALGTLIVASAGDRWAGVLIAPMLLWIGYANAIVGAALA